MDFSGTSYLPACGTGKEIELVWDEVGRTGVMVKKPVGRAAVRGTWAGCSNVKFNGGKSKALPWGWSKTLQQKPEGQEKVEGRGEQVRRGAQGAVEPTSFEERTGAWCWFGLEKGRPRDSLQTPGGRGGRKQRPNFAFGPMLGRGWDRRSPFHPNLCEFVIPSSQADSAGARGMG